MGIFQTDPAYGKNIYRLNAMVELYVPVLPNTSVIPEKGMPAIAAIDGVFYFFNGISWVEVGSGSGDAILNQIAIDQVASFRINGTGQFTKAGAGFTEVNLDGAAPFPGTSNLSIFNVDRTKWVKINPEYIYSLNDFGLIGSNDGVGLFVRGDYPGVQIGAAAPDDTKKSTFNVDGSIALKTSTSSILDGNSSVILINSTTDDTITLPNTVDYQGIVLTIKKLSDGGYINITPPAGSTVNGYESFFLTRGNSSATFIASGTNWDILYSHNVTDSWQYTASVDGETVIVLSEIGGPNLIGRSIISVQAGIAPLLKTEYSWNPSTAEITLTTGLSSGQSLFVTYS